MCLVLQLTHATRFHTSPEFKEEARAFGIPVPEYDGIAEVWVKDIEAWKEIVTDPDLWLRLHFIKAPIHIMLGYDNTVIGEAVKTT